MRLIDAVAWDVDLMTYGIGQAIIGRKTKYTVGEVRSALAKRPTVDAVEVVRCADCKYLQCNMRQDGSLPEGVDEYECRHWCRYCDPTDFCSYGNRREDD